MHLKRHIPIFFAFLLVLTSCEKTIEIDYPEFKPNLVISSTPSPDLSWRVNVSYSKNVLESLNTQYEGNATVIIKNVYTLERIHLKYEGEGDYVLYNAFPKPGHTYELNVHVDDYPMVKATTYIPKTIDAEVTAAQTLTYEGKKAIRVDFEIKDNDESRNFYIYEILSLDSYLPDPGNLKEFINSPIKNWLSTIDGNTGYIVDNVGKQSKLFVTDDSFKGAVLNTSLVSYVEQDRKLPNPPDQYPELPEPDLAKSKLKLSSVSRDMFLYSKSRELILLKNTVNSSLSTPQEPYSNIENGLGLFAGFNNAIYDL